MARVLFYTSLLLELVYIALFVMTIRNNGFRFWPPPSSRSWQFFFAWFLALIVAVNFLFLGLLDFDSFWLPPLWTRFPAAVVLAAPTFIIGIWIYSVFPYRATLGLGNRLITRGPYRYSRNPQYICDSLSIVAFIILTNSWMVLVVGILGVVLNVLAPFTEEPWLEERFGEDYRQYKARVPRFFGHRSTGAGS